MDQRLKRVGWKRRGEEETERRRGEVKRVQLKRKGLQVGMKGEVRKKRKKNRGVRNRKRKEREK